MKIEKYEFTKKNNYNIYLSNGEVITLNERVITKNELLLKKEIDKELYSKVSKNSYIDLYKTWSDQVSEAYQIYLELINKTKH